MQLRNGSSCSVINRVRELPRYARNHLAWLTLQRLPRVQKNAQRLRAAAAGAGSDEILNPSICFLISLAKAAAPAPFTTR